MEYEEMIKIYESMDDNIKENFDMIIRDECPKNFYELVDLWKQSLKFLESED